MAGIDPMKWRIGKVTLTKIVEFEVTGGGRFIRPQATYDAALPIALPPHFGHAALAKSEPYPGAGSARGGGRLDKLGGRRPAGD